jgi:beta-lactamase regulating signal transducer with metallopeptidase domain
VSVFNPLWDHLWQSSLVAALVCCLIPLFRNNSARARYWLWFTASLKFLLPFSLLAALGHMTFVQTVQPQSLAVLARMRPVAMPFSAAVPVAQQFPWMVVFLAVWLAGVTTIAAIWLVRWVRLSTTAHAARLLVFDLPIPVRSTDQLLEPGLVGIWRPVILLPEGIVHRLSTAEIDAILRHEVCHWRRRDNLMAVIHMLVACIFWFHPLVWFVGARLVEEREGACDEEVLAGGGSPLEYARTILKVCELYLRSPLPCAAGVSGADLDRRITAIMARNEVLEIGSGRKALLMVLGLVTILAPFITGGLKPAPVAQLAQDLARALVLPAPKNEAPIAEPSVAAAARARDTARHRKTGPARPIEVHQTALIAPPISASTSVIIIPAPQLDTGQQVAAAEPEEKICRPPQQRTDSRLAGPEVCLSQHEWDRIKQQGLQLMPDGRTLAASFEKEYGFKARTCSYSGGNSATAASSWTTRCF